MNIPRAVGLRVSLARGWVKQIVRRVKRLAWWVQRLVRWALRLVQWARCGGGPEHAVYTFSALTAILTFLYYVLAVHFFSTLNAPQGIQALHAANTQPLIYLYEDQVYSHVRSISRRARRLIPWRSSSPRQRKKPQLRLAHRLISSRSSSSNALISSLAFIAPRCARFFFPALIEPQGTHMASIAPPHPPELVQRCGCRQVSGGAVEVWWAHDLKWTRRAPSRVGRTSLQYAKVYLMRNL